MPKPQPTFTAEFKHEAVQLARTSGKPKAQVAREPGISERALYACCKQAEEHGMGAFPGKGQQMPLEEENHRLKRELERVQQERDSLKKAISIFSRTNSEVSFHCGAATGVSCDRDVPSVGRFGERLFRLVQTRTQPAPPRRCRSD